MITAKELCYCDVLVTPEEMAKEGEKKGYIVHSILQMPRKVGDGYRDHIEWQIAGFWLLESSTLTRREVTLDEMEASLGSGKLIPYHPPTVRKVYIS